MRRTKKANETPDALRERAKSITDVDAEAAMRRLLVDAWDERELLELQADDLEYAVRLAQLRAETSAEAAAAARATIESREAADSASAEAGDIATRRARLASDLEAEEAKIRELFEEIELATARGDVDEALQLEELADVIDLEPLRAELATLAAAENDARDRATQSITAAEKHASEAGELRRDLGSIEARLAPRYEERRRARAHLRFNALWIFDQRVLTAATAAEAALNHWKREAGDKTEIDSANHVDNPVRIVTDAAGKLVGLELPLAPTT